MPRKYHIAISAVAVFTLAAMAFWFLNNEQDVQAQTGAFKADRKCYLTGYRNPGERGQLSFSSATTSFVQLKSAVVETATTTLACDMAGVDAWDMNLLWYSTNTPGALNITVEYSDDNRSDCNAVSTENACNWFGYLEDQRNTSIAVSSSTDSIETALFSGGIFKRNITTRDSTTTDTFRGHRGVFHRWVRFGFKPDTGISVMRLWAEVVLREPIPR